MVLAVVLLITGIAAILLEFFIPSFGLIGIIGAGSIIGSIITAFNFSKLAGSVFLTASLIIVPVMIIIFFRIFPKTLIGKKLILHRNFDKAEGFESTAFDYSIIAGKTGTAVTDLRPSGIAIIDDKKYSVVTGGEYIKKEKEICVVKTEGSKITVAEV